MGNAFSHWRRCEEKATEKYCVCQANLILPLKMLVVVGVNLKEVDMLTTHAMDSRMSEVCGNTGHTLWESLPWNPGGCGVH
jgi:hypothetical protein